MMESVETKCTKRNIYKHKTDSAICIILPWKTSRQHLLNDKAGWFGFLLMRWHINMLCWHMVPCKLTSNTFRNQGSVVLEVLKEGLLCGFTGLQVVLMHNAVPVHDSITWSLLHFFMKLLLFYILHYISVLLKRFTSSGRYIDKY